MSGTKRARKTSLVGRMSRQRSGSGKLDRGFTLIELLIVVAIIGVIAAAAAPNLLNAINRGRQKKTMADMSTIGKAIEAYAVDFGRYPYGATNIPEIANHLCPDYAKTLPYSDGWGHTFIFSSAPAGVGYVIVSFGRDGIPGGGAGFDSTGAGGGGAPVSFTSSFDADIVFENGSFTQLPRGIQSD